MFNRIIEAISHRTPIDVAIVPDITLRAGTLPFPPGDFNPDVYSAEQGMYKAFSTSWGDGIIVGGTVMVRGEKLEFLGQDQDTGKYFYKIVPSEQVVA